MTEPAQTRTHAAQCCVVGGGPAGMMLGMLLARAGVDVVVLEKHADFLRDFRGDTIHPSTLELMHELGVLDAFLQNPHQKLEELKLWAMGEAVELADFRSLPVACPYIAFMPQWDFLDFLEEQTRAMPTFQLRMETEVTEFIEVGDRITGVRAIDSMGEIEIEADLVVAADGRTSVLRDQSGLPLEDIGAPMDVLWTRVSKDVEKRSPYLGRFGNGSLLVTIDRGDYWQCAYVIRKGGFEALKEQGIEHLHERLVTLYPDLADRVHEIETFDDCFLLTVAVNRLEKWTRPGFLCIGDAAHAMSPIGGVGINLAIQDAVCASNLLAPAFIGGADIDKAAAGVQRRRMLPTKLTQSFQVMVQENVLQEVLQNEQPDQLPTPLKLVHRFPLLRRIPARIIGLGIRPEHIETAAANT